MEEFEVKFLKIDPIEIRKKLKKLGAKRLWRRKYRRKLYDQEDMRLDLNHGWLRLRDEGDKITLTFKQRLGKNLDRTGKKNDEGMEEIEVEVTDFDKTAMILERAGMMLNRYVENFRERFILDGVEFDLDEYPLIPPYLEIEAKSWNKIDQVIKKLSLNPEEKKIFSGKQVYAYWGIDEDLYQVITFGKQIRKAKLADLPVK